MHKKHLKGWLKHGDFIILDIICLQLCFVLAYWLIHGYSNPYVRESYLFLAIVMLLGQLLVILFSNNYYGILRRKKFDELLAVGRFILETLVVTLVFLYLIHRSATASRLQVGFTCLFYLVLDYLLRLLNKKRVLRQLKSRKLSRSIVLVTSKKLVREAMAKLTDNGAYPSFTIQEIILLDTDDVEGLESFGIPVGPLDDKTMQNIRHGWVDEVFILQPEELPFPTKLMEQLMEMGITVHYSISALNSDRWPITDMQKLGKYKVLTSSIRFVPAGQAAVKRLLDIAGGLVGCLLTGILCIFIGPAIYIKDPGPVFFKQTRVGRNGKTFQMYKFRSMYMDAEERKAELMAQNKIQDGMMFKITDDPRIIGSEKKDRNGNPCGIGNFIRNTSLDEFPQFINVLKGEMSICGTRPPTLDEWVKYDLGHRVRMSIKPGVTGLWQISGRSEITDFDEVVRLDREYIENWSIWLDIKIILKTIVAVITRKGAE